MKLLAGFLLMVLTQASFAEILVPEITPDSPGYQDIQNSVSQASNFSQRFLDIAFQGIAGSLCFRVETTTSKNKVDTIVLLNGKYFLIPTSLLSADNFHGFQVKDGSDGSTPGIYMLESGFRIDPDLDRPARVVATIRIADPAGNILPALEYQESVTQAQDLSHLEIYPRVNLANFAHKNEAGRTRSSPSDFQVQELLPGDLDYDKVLETLDWAEGGDQAYFTAFTFAGVNGRICIPGQGVTGGNDLPMYLELNGQVFIIPFNFVFADNWNSFTFEQNGIYLIQRGFRDEQTGSQLDRVTSKIRIASMDGSVLPSLEYHEDVEPATTDISDLEIERTF